MTISIVVIIGMALVGLFVGLRYLEAYRRRKDLVRRGIIKPPPVRDRNR